MQRHKAGPGFWGIVVLSVGCAFACPVPLAAQSGGDPAKARIQDMTRRQLQLSNLGEESRRPGDPKRSQAMMDQVSEDFQRILTLHNELVRAIDANKAFNYGFISDAAGEIRKRSARLQSTLGLQKPETAVANPLLGSDAKVNGTKDELIMLCKQIESFVRNPIIDTPGTIDAKQLERARRDLESVVQISTEIKKRADKLNH